VTYTERLAIAQAKARGMFAGWTGNIRKMGDAESERWYAECEIRDGRKRRIEWRKICEMTKE
jgi:hypothetical protein